LISCLFSVSGAGLRIYTGPGYGKLNGLLRMGKEEIARLRQEGKNTFTVTISAINSGIRKLVQHTKFDLDNSILYRGTCNMKMPDQVFEDKNFVEYGFSSATPRREVALQYSGHQHSAIFEIEAGDIDCGATLSWVSQYPGEGEHIILPLSNFQVVRVRQQTQGDILEETRKFLEDQSQVMQKRLQTEKCIRGKHVHASFLLRYHSLRRYQTHRQAVLVLQSRMRVSMLRHVLRQQQQQVLSVQEAVSPKMELIQKMSTLNQADISRSSIGHMGVVKTAVWESSRLRRGQFKTDFQTCFLVLSNATLEYYEDEKSYLAANEGGLKGSIPTKNLSVTPATPSGVDKSNDLYHFTIKCTSNDKVIECACTDAEARGIWVQKIEACYQQCFLALPSVVSWHLHLPAKKWVPALVRMLPWVQKIEACYQQRFLALPSVVSWCLHLPANKTVPPLERLRSTQAADLTRAGQMVSSSRMRLYQRPPLPGPVPPVCNSQPASLEEELDVIEVYGGRINRIERLASDKARLERRLKDFFVDVVPDQALEGPKILRETACSDFTSQEARVNEMLRKMKIQDRIAIGLDLTSSRIERGVRQKEMDLQLRSEELEKACQEGWAKLLLKDPQIVNIYEMKLNINLNAHTLQQLQESRKSCVLDFAKSLLQETREYLSGVNTYLLASGIITKDMQSLELELLETWREKDSDWYNKDIENFKNAIDGIFETWKKQLSKNADNLTLQAQETSTNSRQEGCSPEDMEKALKLLRRAVLIAERALPSKQRSIFKSILADIAERQSDQAHEEVGGNVTPAASVSTALFEQVAALLATQQETDTDTQTKESETSDWVSKTVSNVLPIVLTALKVRRENFNTRQLSLTEGKKLLQQIIETYSKTFPDYVHLLDLITFLHPEILKCEQETCRSFDPTKAPPCSPEDMEKSLKSTGISVCLLVKALNQHGIKSFEDFVSYFSEDDVRKMKLSQDLADKLKQVVQITKNSVVHEMPAQAERVQMDEAQADKILQAHAGACDVFNRPVVFDGLARFSPLRPLSLDKLVQFLSSLSNEPLSASLTVLERGVEAIGLFLAGAHADAILMNDLGMLVYVYPDIHTCGASERLYYCGRKNGLNLPACGNGGQQCKSCARLQERSYRLLLRQYAPEHVSRVCENEAFLTECCHALNKVMTTWPASSGIQAMGCFAIFNLACLDNGKVIACGTWSTITRVIEFGLHNWNERVLSCALRALHRVLGSNDGASGDMQDCVDCNAVAASNVISSVETEQVSRLIENIVETLVVHRRNENLQMLGIRCLHILSSVPQILTNVAQAGGGIGVEVIIRAMLDKLKNTNTDVGVCLQRLCCSALLHICRDTGASLLLVAIGCVSTLAQVLDKYPTDVAALVMRLLIEICRNLPKDNENFPAQLQMATQMRQVWKVLHDKHLADARPYALMCEIIYILADGANDICNKMLSNGAKGAVEGAKNMHATDHHVQEWADKCLRVLDPPPPAPLTLPAPMKQSACCEVQ
jgi:hypothetical protein